MIPNIVKGTGITGALAYAMGQGNDAQTGERLELVPGEKSRAEILGGQNFGFEIDSPARLELARRMMEWQALPENQAGKTRKLERDCFHASLSWGDGQTPTREEMLEAGESFLKAVGLENARAVFIRHDDTDHAHIHVVASRIDPETGRSLTLDNDFIHGQKWAAQWERDHGQERTPEQGRKLHSLIDAVERRDAGAVLSHLTRDKATFQPWEVNRALAYGNLDAGARDKFRAEILGQPNVIGLRETADAEVSRYTTREVLAAEMALQRNAAALAGDERHGIKGARIDKASADFTLNPEQAAALRHLTGAEGFAMLWGEAGTGKSHTLKATRAAYEAEGKSVIGLSWTNDVVQQMRGDGFRQANTIASEMSALEKGRTSWNRNTVLMVDEAAMVSTDNLARVTAAAKQAGAKLILAGDDKQLPSIEAGGMFETLRQTHGAAILKEVQRVRDPEQKAAFGQMHDGGFLEPLKTFEKAGGVHWTTRQSDTLREMAARYTADLAAAPDKSRFMFAATNKDVATLNQHARAQHRARGDLGEDHTLQTAAGAQEFTTGDRIQFTGNGRTQAEKNAGLTNGRVGTVSALEIDRENRARVTVDLDTAKGAEPQQVSFIVGEDARAGEFSSFRHGYAGTIYRGQGRTLDEVYVAHSPYMRSSAAYVALTRHRESVHIYAARERVKDLEAMAESMARPDNKRAATAYRIDEQSAARAELENAIAGFSGRQPAIAETPARTATAGATDMADRPQAQSAPAGQTAPEAAQDAAAGIEAGAALILDGVAGFAEKAIEALADIFGGGSSPAPPKQEPPAKPVKQTHAERVQAFLEAERQQRQETARRLGVGDAMSEDELRREQEAQEKRSRDRGGGQSL